MQIYYDFYKKNQLLFAQFALHTVFVYIADRNLISFNNTNRIGKDLLARRKEDLLGSHYGFSFGNRLYSGQFKLPLLLNSLNGALTVTPYC